MSHANALLAPKGRLKLAMTIVVDGWTIRRAADRFQCSPTTAKKWADRYRAGGEAAMVDRSSRPLYSPGRTPTQTERRIINLRFTRRWGPHRVAFHLHLPRSTVGAVLRRFKMPLLRNLDQNTGLAVRRPKPVRYEHDAPGDLVHVDIKKLGRIRRRRRPPQTRTPRRQAQQQTPRSGLCVHSSRRRRPLPARVFGDPRRRKEGNRLSVLDPRQCLLQLPRYRRQTRAHRQRILLPLRTISRNARRGHQAQTDSAVPAANQRQSRTIQPHPEPGMGLRPHLPLRGRSRSDLPRLGP